MSVYPDTGSKGYDDGSFNQGKPFDFVPLNEIGLGEKPTRVKPR